MVLIRAVVDRAKKVPGNKMKKAGRSVCFAYNLHGVDRGGLRNTPLFSQLFLCLSRACLGKMFGLYINGAKSGVFLQQRFGFLCLCWFCFVTCGGRWLTLYVGRLDVRLRLPCLPARPGGGRRAHRGARCPARCWRRPKSSRAILLRRCALFTELKSLVLRIAG